MNISQAVVDFATLAIQSGGYMAMDRIYLQNKLLALVGEKRIELSLQPSEQINCEQVLACLVNAANQNNQIKANERQHFQTLLLDYLTPPPSVVNAYFAEHYHQSPEAATDYFYQLSQQSGYLQSEVMLNQSSCWFCLDNEGYASDLSLPSQANRRFIRMNIDGESWFFQYLPQGQLIEQAVVLSEIHQPLSFSAVTFLRQLRIAEILPHYFVVAKQFDCSKHGHYQLGRGQLAIDQAKISQYIELTDFLGVTVAVANCPFNLIRLLGYNIEELADASYQIADKWRNFFTLAGEEKLDNTPTVVARRQANQFEINLILLENGDSEAIFDLSQLVVGSEKTTEKSRQFDSFIKSLS